MIILKEQKPDQIVDVGQWRIDEEYGGIYPEGKREKNLFIAPGRDQSLPVVFDFCVPGRRYLFKKSKQHYPEEYWMEIFAYHLGCLLGISVPATFVGFNSKTQIPGALSEWFYDSSEEKLIPGGDLLQAVDAAFDRKKGRQHNFQSIMHLLSHASWKLNALWKQDWVKMLTFDALIGNTDRHQDNWGILVDVDNITKTTSIKMQHAHLAPAFDNGSSMAREIKEEDFPKYYEDQSKLQKFIDKGKPHIKWDLATEYKLRDNHAKLLSRILQTYPELRAAIMSCLQFSENQIENILNTLQKFDLPHPLTQKRAEFMLHLLMCRQTHLKSYLERANDAVPNH